MSTGVAEKNWHTGPAIRNTWRKIESAIRGFGQRRLKYWPCLRFARPTLSRTSRRLARLKEQVSDRDSSGFLSRAVSSERNRLQRLPSTSRIKTTCTSSW